MEKRYLPDTSAIISGEVSEMIRKGKIAGKLLIHRAVLFELKNQADKKRLTGFIGLREVEEIRKLCKDVGIEFEIVGEYPTSELPVDIILVEYAKDNGCVLITGDAAQSMLASSIGVEVLYIKKEEGLKLEQIEKLFTEDTMSVHVKEGAPIFAKRGKPGNWEFVKVGDRPVTREEIEKLIMEIVETARHDKESFIEIDRPSITIVQLRNYRIIIAKPPFSDGFEVTIVRPIKKLTLYDYNLPHKLLTRLERAEGIVIAGPPGSGKSTFAQALAEYYHSLGKIVKTVESPRDLDLPPAITQYSKNYGTSRDIHDVLLLSRPDYTIFDEVRDDEDFDLYIDMRLAGVGMVGVVHASSPIDAIQRFIRRVELGMIPSIIDTVIYMENGKIQKVYSIRMTVRVPTGLTERDLARPVIEIRDFLADTLEYEIYKFGEETVVVPVRAIKERRMERVVEQIKREYGVEDVLVEDDTVRVYMPKKVARRMKARKIKRLIERLERLFNKKVELELT